MHRVWMDIQFNEYYCVDFKSQIATTFFVNILCIGSVRMEVLIVWLENDFYWFRLDRSRCEDSITHQMSMLTSSGIVIFYLAIGHGCMSWSNYSSWCATSTPGCSELSWGQSGFERITSRHINERFKTNLAPWSSHFQTDPRRRSVHHNAHCIWMARDSANNFIAFRMIIISYHRQFSSVSHSEKQIINDGSEAPNQSPCESIGIFESVHKLNCVRVLAFLHFPSSCHYPFSGSKRSERQEQIDMLVWLVYCCVWFLGWRNKLHIHSSQNVWCFWKIDIISWLRLMYSYQSYLWVEPHWEKTHTSHISRSFFLVVLLLRRRRLRRRFFHFNLFFSLCFACLSPNPIEIWAIAMAFSFINFFNCTFYSIKICVMMTSLWASSNRQVWTEFSNTIFNEQLLSINLIIFWLFENFSPVACWFGRCVCVSFFCLFSLRFVGWSHGE